MKLPSARVDFSKTILLWYKKNKRDFPWRKTTNPYYILVSELMLQQTQTDRVIPYYQKFLKRYPTPLKLVQSDVHELYSYWAGLGYNRRALFLQKAAQYLITHEFPNDVESLQQVPGIGPYTASAIAAFAFNQDIVVMDTNIRRIYSRVFFNGAGTVDGITKKADELLPRGKSCDWHNALMDFGATICTAKNPKCSTCPLSKTCTAFKSGKQDVYLRIAPPQPKFIGSKREVRGSILRTLGKLPSKSLFSIDDVRVLVKADINRLVSKTLLKSILSDLEKEGFISMNSSSLKFSLKK